MLTCTPEIGALFHLMKTNTPHVIEIQPAQRKIGALSIYTHQFSE